MTDAELVKLATFAKELRKYWSFDDGQMHTHSWHDRENFIERILPRLLAAQQDGGREATIEECARTAEKAWPPAHTYASENADYYAGQDHAVRTAVSAIRKLKRRDEQSQELG